MYAPLSTHAVLYQSHLQNMAKVEADFHEELTRALKDGFTADEVEKAKKTWLANAPSNAPKKAPSPACSAAGSVLAALCNGTPNSRPPSPRSQPSR